MVQCGVSTDPRVVRTRSTVLQVAAEILGARGYEGFTIDAVVHDSGVAKTTIYRHWPTRADLLHDVLLSAKPAGASRETGDLRRDLITVLGSVARATTQDVFLRSMPSLVVAAQQDSELKALHSRLADERSAGLRGLLNRARDRGDLRAGCNIELLAHTLIGLVFVRRILRDLPVGHAEITQVVDLILDGAAPGNHSVPRPPGNPPIGPTSTDTPSPTTAAGAH